jgi:hypothetical protein
MSAKNDIAEVSSLGLNISESPYPYDKEERVSHTLPKEVYKFNKVE